MVISPKQTLSLYCNAVSSEGSGALAAAITSPPSILPPPLNASRGIPSLPFASHLHSHKIIDVIIWSLIID